jgi:hypothetical protein
MLSSFLPSSSPKKAKPPQKGQLGFLFKTFCILPILWVLLCLLFNELFYSFRGLICKNHAKSGGYIVTEQYREVICLIGIVIDGKCQINDIKTEVFISYMRF